MMFVLTTLILISAAFQERCFASKMAYETGPDGLPVYVTVEKLKLKMVNGSSTDPGDWPWQILLERNGKFQCGGTLHKRRMKTGLKRSVAAGKSSRYMVITAAHCFKNLNRTYTVIVGEHNRSVSTGFEQNISVKKVVIHQNYSGVDLPDFLENDIAILFLEKDPKLNEFVKPIPRFSTKKLDRKALKSKKCFVLGWGDTKEGLGQPEFSDILLKLKTKVLKNFACKKGLEEVDVDSGLLNPTNVCTNNAFASFCGGDSGGTLLCDIDNIWTHVGVVSWAAAGCVSPYPNVYTRVSKYRKWIKKTEMAEM